MRSYASDAGESQVFGKEVAVHFGTLTRMKLELKKTPSNRPERDTMSHTDLNTLLARGRKAGLGTAELYAALSTRPAEGSEGHGQADCNGFVSQVNSQGQTVFRPAKDEQRDA